MLRIDFLIAMQYRGGRVRHVLSSRRLPAAPVFLRSLASLSVSRSGKECCIAHKIFRRNDWRVAAKVALAVGDILSKLILPVWDGGGLLNRGGLPKP